MSDVLANGPTGSAPRTKVVSDLDNWLFVPDRWFAIDEQNAAAAGVVVASLQHGMELASASAVTPGGRRLTFAGRLRAEVVAVDVDVDGVVGDAIVEHLVSWCLEHRLWHLVRPSGGSGGRAHVFIVPAGLVEDLEAYTRQLRADYRTTGMAVDVRGGRHPQKALRPLSAPHRSGKTTRPLGPLTRLLAELRQVLPTPPSPAEPRRSQRAHRGSRGREGHRPALSGTKRGGRQSLQDGLALVPTRRGRRELPQPWAAYLGAGKAAPVATSDRSEVELRATAVLLRCGLDAANAWTAIADSPANVMVKAKARGPDWWTRHVWNAAVRTEQQYRAGHVPASRPAEEPQAPVNALENVVDRETLTAVAAARAALTVLQWRITARRRPAVLLVAHTLLDRMAREGTTTVPCPLRNLLLDTGLSLRTASGALNDLDGLLGRRVAETFDPARRDSSSHTFVLDRRFGDLFLPGQVTPRAEDLGVSLTATPVSHPPSRARPLPPGTWVWLGASCHAVWRVLIGHSEGLTVTSVAREAGLTSGPLAEMSPRQIRTLRSHLRDLAGAGLASVDAGGQWRGQHRMRSASLVGATLCYEALADQVTAERAAYRAGPHLSAGWRYGREQALCRQRQVDRARQLRWLAQLSTGERASRRDQFARRFASTPLVQQCAWKHEWALRRAQAGTESESARHDRWLAALSDADYARRAVERAFTFSRLPAPLQVAFAQEWHQHRATWQVSRGPQPAELATLNELAASIGRETRDAAYLAGEQGPTLPADWGWAAG